MSRALWIAFTAIFASLLIYLAFVGHREQVVRMTSAMPNVLNGLTGFVERISLPGKQQTADRSNAPEIKEQTRKTLPKTIKTPQKIAKNSIPQKPEAATDITLQNVKYGPQGQLVLSGNAAPGARLDFSIDGMEVKQQNLTADGSWKLVVPKGILSGQHKLEVSVLAQANRPKTIVVLPFVKAGPEEIAALSSSRKMVDVQRIPDDLKVVPTKDADVKPAEKPQNLPGKPDLPKSEELPVRKTAPGFSKLAKMERSQSVKSDIDPLTGLLPKLMIGDGPSLLTPQADQKQTNRPKPEIELKSGKPEAVKPVLKQQSNQPELAVPQFKTAKKTPNTATEPSDSQNIVEKKRAPKREKKIVLNTPPLKKGLLPKTTPKEPYTGYRRVMVAAGRGLVVVQPGNTLWDLAISIYGSGHYYQKLYRANWRHIRNPQMIFPGQIIFAPDADPPTSIAPISPPQWLPPQ